MQFLDKLKQLEDQERLVEAFQDIMSANKLDISMSKTLADISFYHSIAIGTGTSGVLFEGDAATSNTNLRSFIKPQGEHTVITDLQILTGNSASLNATDWTPVTTGDAWLKNGYFTIYVNGVKASERIPATDFLSDVESDKPGMRQLVTPIVWPGQSELRIEFSSQSAGAANDNLRVVVGGVGLV